MPLEENQTDFQFNETLWFTNHINLTNGTNTTSPLSGYSRGQYNEERLKRINNKYIAISVITIVVNLLVVLLITTSRENRRKTFLWHILSFSVWYLLYGTFTIPLKLDYQTGYVWMHGVTVCRIFTVTQFCHLSLCCLILVCASVDRMLAKVQLMIRINERLTKALNYLLVLLPWILVITVTLPLILVSEKRFEGQGVKWCVMSIQDAYLVRTVVVLYITPMSILGLAIFILILLYMLIGDNRKCLSSETTKAEITSMRMSTVATWLACILFFVSWVPAISTLAAWIFHDRNDCILQYQSYIVIRAIYESTGATVPFVWLLLVEIRTSMKSWMKIIRNRIRMRNFSQISTPMGWINRNEQSDI